MGRACKKKANFRKFAKTDGVGRMYFFTEGFKI